MNEYLKNKILSYLLFKVILLVLAIPLQAQTHANDSIQHINSIPLSEITFQYDELQNTLEDILKDSRIPESILSIDSLFKNFSIGIDSLGNELLSDTSISSRPRIEILTNEWKSYSQKLLNWQLTIADHNRKVEVYQDSLSNKLLIWERSHQLAVQEEAPDEMVNRIQSAIDSALSAKKQLANINNWMIVAQDKLISLQSKVNKVLDHLEEQESNFRGNLFVIDSDPVWKWKISKTGLLSKELSLRIADQKRILLLFIDEYSWQFVFHFIVFVFLVWFFRFLKKKYLHTDFPGDDQRIKLAKITLQNAFTSAVVLGFMISIYYYRNAPNVVSSLLTILVAFPVILLFPKFVNIRGRSFLYLIVAVFFIQKIQDLIISDVLINRVVQILKSGIIIYVLSFALKNQKSKQEGFGNKYWKSIVRYFGPVFLFIAVFSATANILGAYQLSEILISGVINTSIYAFILMIYGVILSSIIIILLRSKYAYSLEKFTRDNVKFELRITGLIYLYMLYLWIKSTLTGFKILNPAINIYNDFVDLFWIVGGVKISVGGILSFLVILVVTFLLARIIREIINDNVIPVKSSGRGLPNAFSMVIRYMIVTLGVYIALSAAGIDLSEFGLVAGALGVGLGFGLQDILHNLVSGLIVSFERPIHVGDTVQVDQLHGIVTEIGVRSSKIKTFDGSEVILPNGDLLSKQVINWTLTDQKRRLEIKIKTSFDANPREVIDTLKAVVMENENVLSDPNPLFLFEGYGDSALHFRVLFWVYYNVGLSTKSEVALAIYDKLKEKRIEAPIPQQRLIYLDNPKQEDKPL